MREFSLKINGESVSGRCEPRTHLADFLREGRYLTGTHIGCEHGVCGACTVLVDGSPARSCITYAVACEGAEVTTIEGLRDDPIMADLRRAFSDHHALQCGYCTPAMLISCHDIVARLPEADERRIRLELSGNLCRCTGYVGIVEAVKEVLDKRRSSGARLQETHRGLGPVGAHAAASPGAPPSAPTSKKPAVPAAAAITAEQWRAVETEGAELPESFRVEHGRDRVWHFFEDLEQVARCVPGARLTAPPQDGRAEGEVHVKLGPMVTAFAGVLEVERDPEKFTGIVRGAGRDARSGSNARAIIRYQVEAEDDDASRVDILVKFLLSGPLAQFGRSGLVRDVADHMTELFANNLKSAISGQPVAEDQGASLNAAAMTWALLRNRVRTGIRTLCATLRRNAK